MFSQMSFNSLWNKTLTCEKQILSTLLCWSWSLLQLWSLTFCLCLSVNKPVTRRKCFFKNHIMKQRHFETIPWSAPLRSILSQVYLINVCPSNKAATSLIRSLCSQTPFGYHNSTFEMISGIDWNVYSSVKSGLQ